LDCRIGGVPAVKGQPGLALSTGKERADRAADYLCIDYGCSTPELGICFVDQLAVGEVIVVGYVIGQAAIHKILRSTSKFLAPGSVLSLGLDDLIQAALREIF
jgi:hypothetical protein